MGRTEIWKSHFFLLSFPSFLPSLPDPSAIKQRFLPWCHCESSSDFGELWVGILTKNLELSCLQAFPMHFPELRSHQCMHDFRKFGRKFAALDAGSPALSCLSMPGAATGKQQSCSTEHTATVSKARLQSLSLKMKLLSFFKTTF